MYEATSYYYCLVCRKKITYRSNSHLRDNFCDNFCKYLYHYRIQNRVSPQPMTQYLCFNKNKLEMKCQKNYFETNQKFQIRELDFPKVLFQIMKIPNKCFFLLNFKLASIC